LLLAGTGIILFDSVLFRGYLERDLSALTQIIADNSTVALAFDDPKSATEMLSALHSRIHLADACIYRSDGSILASYFRTPSRDACPAAQAAQALTETTSAITISQPILLGGRRLGTLVIENDLGDIAERTRLYGATVLGVVVVASLLVFFLSSRLRENIVNPIAQLVRATASVSQSHDYSVRALKVSGDEMGVLVDRFNEMLAGIQTREDNLKKALVDRELALLEAERAKDRFRFMAESMPQKIFTATPDGAIDYLNRQWEEFSGIPLEQMVGWSWTNIVHPFDVEENVRAWKEATATGQPFRIENRLRRADGQYRWHLTRAQAMRDEAGAITMWIGSITDIHEQREREEQLKRANEDLQQFAYSASHDLQEPIRNVSLYSEIIARRYDHLLDSDGRQFLGFLSEGGRRLARLIGDLLAYTRAGAPEETVASNAAPAADASQVADQTLADLAEAVRESHATVTYHDLPEVQMSRAHLHQVFQNLIGNALKYRRDEALQVHISADRLGTCWRFSVVDNGIGIDPQYKEKIFGVFKRLHRDQKYSGTGIGLAICQRVVARYGGRIWVESTPGEGSAFYFTIPDRAPRAQSASAESTVG